MESSTQATTESPNINFLDGDPYFVETQTITSPNGPTSITRNIMQDIKGNIWLAAWEGIMRYDGKEFVNFTNKEGLRRYHVFTVLEDSQGDIWFGTIGAGLYHYDGTTFTNITKKDGLADDKLGCIYEDKNGNIWFGTMGGVSFYDRRTSPKEYIKFRNYTMEDGLTDNDINSIIEDESGKIWFGTRGKTCTFDGKTFTPFTQQSGRNFINVRSIIEDENGAIWLGGNDGLWSYKNGLYTNYTKNFVGYIYEDSKGHIWTSSEQGGGDHNWVLSRYDKKPLAFEKREVTPMYPKTGMLFGITEDDKGNIWVGSVQGVSRYDGKSFNFFRKEEMGK